MTLGETPRIELVGKLQELYCGAQLGRQSNKGVVEHTLRKNPTSIIFFDHGLLDEFENRDRVLFLC